MPLFLITVTHRRAANNTVLEKGMTIEVSTLHISNLFANRGPLIEQAFRNKYGIELSKLGGVGNIRQYLQIEEL